MAKFNAAKSEAASLTGPRLKTKLEEIWTIQFPQTALTELFWASCYRDFPDLLGKNNIDIREGWRVVWRRNDNS